MYDAYASFIDSLPARYVNLELRVCATDAELDAALAETGYTWVMHWSSLKPQEALVLRAEPYVLAVHPTLFLDTFSLSQLAALAEQGNTEYTFVVGDNGQVAQELLGIPQIGEEAVRAENWEAAKEYIATHERAVGLLPWDVVDARVQVLPVDGYSLDARRINTGDFADYPLVRHLRLSGDRPPPAALVADLDAALQYQAPRAVQLAAVGDVMLASYVGQTIQATSPRYPFEGAGVQELLSQADIAIGNLECAVSERGERVNKTYTFRADPAVIEGLQYAGFDVLSLANNHTGDFGDDALLDTLDALHDAGMVTIGAGRTITEAHEAKFLDMDGLRLAFLAYNQIYPPSFAATATSPGSAFMSEERMVADVQAARQLADVVIVACHWGIEYSSYPDASQRRLARLLADAGASLILGHHPHVVQGLEYHQDALTAYSLGNFVFYHGPTAETVETVIMECVVDSSGVKMVRLVPVAIRDHQPNVLSPEEGARVLERIMRVTREQNALPKE